MKLWCIQFLLACLLLISNTGIAVAQLVNGKAMLPTGPPILDRTGRVLKTNSFFKIVDGVIHTEIYVPGSEVLREWTISDKDEIEAILPGSPAESVLVTNTTDTKLEKYIFEKLKQQIDTIPYKLPIIMNERFIVSYRGRREAMKFIKPSEIKTMRFLPKPEAQQKYGKTILFGAIELTK
ncbi:MAG TPA: hypothetical protein VM802_21855 [Chitinophaga sp.]|uniref:hypothetical protein n=1 Tax=Chitinophaga sp. TaxID=1869181 RepID=UPI002B8AFAFC|nr:hypothetical protein [Chitinophaga sp.]HVI47531.1 hypothetical protein [Chitinophaga sp.]